MTNVQPLVTIGLTCYNAADTIGRAIAGAAAQDYPNTEIIIVNDCSADNSVEIVETAIRDLPNARLINHEKNTGFAGALNSIIANAAGEFLAIFDDDDVSLPNRVSTQLRTFLDYEQKTGAEYIACWGSGYREYSNGYKFRFKAIGSQPKVPVGRDLINCQLYMPRDPDVFFGSGTPSCSLFVRKNLYDRIGLYDTNMRRTEDTDFALRLAMKGGHFIGCPEDVIAQTATVGFDKRPEVQYKSELALIEKYRNLFPDARRYNYAKDWIYLRYRHFGRQRVHSILALARLAVKYPRWTYEQFMRSAPKRLAHEREMARNARG